MTDNWEPPPTLPSWLDRHQRPNGVDDETVAALGRLGEAAEWMERARGRLYDFHQMSGRVDLLLGEAADLFGDAGHDDLASALRTHLVGRNVLEGRWSFQIVEEYDATYWVPVRDFHDHSKQRLVDGADHVHESEMKQRRRSRGRARHAARPTMGTTA